MVYQGQGVAKIGMAQLEGGSSVISHSQLGEPYKTVEITFVDRDMTDTMADELTKQDLTPVWLVELFFPSKTVRMWTGYGDITFSNNTYSGAGDFGKIESLPRETEEVQSNEISLILSGVPADDHIEDALNEEFQGHDINLYLGLFDDSIRDLFNDPIQVFGGEMSEMPITEDGKTATVKAKGRSRLAQLRNKNERRLTHRDQQEKYSDDLFLEFMASVPDKKVSWGGQSN